MSRCARGMRQQIDAFKDYKIEGIFGTFGDHNATEDNIRAIRDVVEEGVDGLILWRSVFNRRPVAEYMQGDTPKGRISRSYSFPRWMPI